MDISAESSIRRNPIERAGRGFGRPAAQNAIIAGSLLGDIENVARELCRALQYNPITVWMNADADVLYQPADSALDVTPNWIAGTYGFGANLADIADDLDLLRAERRATGMLDD